MRVPIILTSAVLLFSTLSASASTAKASPVADATDTVLGIGAAGAATFGIAHLFSSSPKSTAVTGVAQAPEISPEGLGGGISLLSGTFLIMTGRRRKR